MSLDELRNDLKVNMKSTLAIVDPSTREHLQNTLWPFLEAIVDVVDEMDDAVAELVDHEEDYLQPETAAVFAAVIQTSLALMVELKKRPDMATAQLAVTGPDGKPIAVALKDAVEQHEQLCAQAIELLGSVTMIPSEDEDEEDEDAAEATEDGNE